MNPEERYEKRVEYLDAKIKEMEEKYILEYRAGKDVKTICKEIMNGLPRLSDLRSQNKEYDNLLSEREKIVEEINQYWLDGNRWIDEVLPGELGNRYWVAPNVSTNREVEDPILESMIDDHLEEMYEDRYGGTSIEE